MKKFIIFLDIDGVLCSYLDMNNYEPDGDHKFSKNAISALNKIIKFYNADLCMISGWNSHFKNEEEYKTFLISRGINVNNLSIGDSIGRHSYVTNYIKNNDCKYLVIDDEPHKWFEKCIITNDIEYKRILAPNRYRCLDKYDVHTVTKNWNLNE